MNAGNVLGLSFILFSISAAAFITQKNLLITLMSLELGLNAANIAIVSFALTSNKSDPFIWIFLFFAVAAAEATIGLSILIMISKKFKTINPDKISNLKG